MQDCLEENLKTGLYAGLMMMIVQDTTREADETELKSS
jgi:hypothetical protein